MLFSWTCPRICLVCWSSWRKFPDEGTRWTHLRGARWGENGKHFACPMCNEDEHWGDIKTRKRWECYQCVQQTSVTSRTIMHDTKLDLRTWFLTAYFVSTTKQGISSHELARKLDITQADPGGALDEHPSLTLKAQPSTDYQGSSG